MYHTNGVQQRDADTNYIVYLLSFRRQSKSANIARSKRKIKAQQCRIGLSSAYHQPEGAGQDWHVADMEKMAFEDQEMTREKPAIDPLLLQDLVQHTPSPI